MNTKAIVSCVIALVCALFLMTANAATGITTLVSVSSDGLPGNKGSTSPSVSADGRFVVFSSYANNLVTGDANEYSDIFVHDRQTGETTLVSVASNGAQANKASHNPSISADGRFVVFHSAADNLVARDTNGYSYEDIFVHDRQTGETTRVRVASDGAQANSSSIGGISEDGHHVVFFSYADNLVTGDTNGNGDIFVHDRQTGETTLVSVASDGTQGNSLSEGAGISADGRFVAFGSDSTNLVAGDTNEQRDIFIHDRQTGETTRVNTAPDGTQANNRSYGGGISADGRYVTFISPADNLVAEDTNDEEDFFVHDRQTGKITRANVIFDNIPGTGLIISADRRFAVFESDAIDLVPGNENQFPWDKITNVFVHNFITGETTRIDVATDGTEGNGFSDLLDISADGRVVVFRSTANNLTEGLTGGRPMIFVHERLVGSGPLAEPQVVNLPLNIPAPLMLKGRDLENDPLTFNVVMPPEYGTLSGTAPDLVYTPNIDFFGVDRFTFTVTDGVETSAPAPVILRVSSTTTSNNTLCSTLGNHPDKARLDRDSFFFRGNGGEDITIKLEKNPDGVSTGNRVYMVLWQVKDRKLVKPRLVYKQGQMPIELKTTLLEKGNYLINVVERRGAPFIGDYCLSLNASEEAADTLKATRSVE